MALVTVWLFRDRRIQTETDSDFQKCGGVDRMTLSWTESVETPKPGTGPTDPTIQPQGLSTDLRLHCLRVKSVQRLRTEFQ